MGNINDGFIAGGINAPICVGIDTPILLSLNASTIHVGIVFTADRTDTLNGFNVAINNVSGTPTNGLAASLYATSASHVPTGGALASNSGVTPTANAVNNIAFASGYTVTAGTEYFIDITNVAGTPASNYFRVMAGATPSYYGNIASVSTGTTLSYWFGNAPLSVCMSLNYATAGDVGYAFPYGQLAFSPVLLYNSAGTRVAREGLGVKFDGQAKLLGVTLTQGLIPSAGGMTWLLNAELCTVGASVGVSDTTVQALSGSGVSSGVPNQFYFGTPYALPANTFGVVDITPIGTSGQNSSNYVRHSVYPAHIPSGVLSGVIQGGYSSTASPGPTFSVATYLPLMLMYFEPPSASGGGAPSIGVGPLIRGLSN